MRAALEFGIISRGAMRVPVCFLCLLVLTGLVRLSEAGTVLLDSSVNSYISLKIY